MSNPEKLKKLLIQFVFLLNRLDPSFIIFNKHYPLVAKLLSMFA